jgi:hypothetical protein
MMTLLLSISTWLVSAEAILSLNVAGIAVSLICLLDDTVYVFSIEHTNAIS